MGNNFHTPWPTTVHFLNTEMNPLPAELDRGLSYLKNIIVHCDGVVSYNPTTGVLIWSGTIRILFNRADGKAIQNTMAAGYVTLTDGQFAYVDLNETDGTAISVGVATVTTNAASNFISYNRLVLGYRNTASDLYFPVYLQAMIRSTVTTTDASETTIESRTLTEGKAYIVEAHIVACQGADLNRAAYVRRACVYRASGGSAALQGSVQDGLTIESESAWDVDIDVNGNDVRVRVTGAAEMTVVWACTLSILET
jgi:hypothetical protein